MTSPPGDLEPETVPGLVKEPLLGRFKGKLQEEKRQMFRVPLSYEKCPMLAAENCDADVYHMHLSICAFL